VQARLGPFLREGQKIDVTVISAQDAKSLFGGQLLETPLEGADGRVYATAAGPVTVGGFRAEGDAAKIQQNHVTVGRIPGGGNVERELRWDIVSPHHEVGLLLREPDYVNATRIAAAVNAVFPGTASAVDAGRVRVRLPEECRAKEKQVPFLAALVEIAVDPAVPARVVLNERTGTIIAGGDIAIGPVSISHGNLIIAIAETPEVSQPAPFSRGGTTKVVPRTKVEAGETGSPVVRIPKGTQVADMAAALNAVGISPRDMVIIFQMLKRAGALHAELVVE
jgi:flagellar P-ring protein precursor FlgI